MPSPFMIVIDDAHELGSDVLDLVTFLRAGKTSGNHILMFGETQLRICYGAP
ncbi:MAG: hypothetical protein CM1200mP40_23910 [Gammaproteobacteria bacterium]|nr:MAG: hypothetical protein CM1200mP40_23910 [Gammaproteobacteria bacterium]